VPSPSPHLSSPLSVTLLQTGVAKGGAGGLTSPSSCVISISSLSALSYFTANRREKREGGWGRVISHLSEDGTQAGMKSLSPRKIVDQVMCRDSFAAYRLPQIAYLVCQTSQGLKKSIRYLNLLAIQHLAT
jgi:hypothetical protein